MAVAYISDVDKTPATGTSIAYTSFAVSGTNPVIVLLIAADSSGAALTVSSVVCSAGLTSGTPVEVGTVGSGVTPTSLRIWAIPAPSGTGTITATLANSIPWQSNAILLQGAHQTTPCPIADSASILNDATNPLVVTPANLTANDAAVGAGANATAGDAPTFQQTQTFNNNSTAVNMAAGYHLGTGSVSVNWGSSQTVDCILAARVAAAAASATAALTGTATASITEADVVTGGKTIILTLTGDTYIAAGTGPIGSIANTTDLINGIDSGQSEATGWDTVVKASLITNMATAVVRTSATVCTITLTANATYNITAQETITATIPAAVLTLAAPIVASPTFTVATAAAAVAPTVNDAATLTESVSMKMHLQNLTVNDAPTVTEALTMHMPISVRMEKLA